MTECDECGFDPDEYREEIKSEYRPRGLEQRIMKKQLDLQNQLIRHFTNEELLSDNDIIRYSAMVEVLKAVLQ